MPTRKKYRQVKNRRLVVDDLVFVYSIIAYEQVLKVRFYHERKTPFLEVAFDYPSLWSVDIYRPKVLVTILQKHLAGHRTLVQGLQDLSVVTVEESQRWVPSLAAIEPPTHLG